MTTVRTRNRSLRGGLVCLAMFVLGGAVLWGLFEAPKARSPASPGVPWGASTEPIRFVALEFAGQSGVSAALTKQLVSLGSDYVLVQNIRFDDVLPLAEALGMARSYHPVLFQRPDPRSKDAPGDLLLSKHPLYDARPIALDSDPLHTHMRGVEAIAVMNGTRFRVVSGVGATASSLRALDTARQRSGSQPIVLATGFVRPEMGEGQYRGDLNAVMPVSLGVEQGGPIVPAAMLFADPTWVATAASVTPRADGKGLILYAELKAWTPAAAAATKAWR